MKPKSIEGLSDKLLDQHWNLYEGYVKNTNLLNKAVWDAIEAGKEANKPEVAEMVRRFGFEYNGMVLHEYYFTGMQSGVQEPIVSSPLSSSLASIYGGMDNWKKNFLELGKMRGTGWVVTYLDPLSQHVANLWVSDHEAGHIAGFIPLLIMDCWEHAYVTDYGASADGRAEYAKTYFKNINWEVVEERFDAALQGRLTLRVRG